MAPAFESASEFFVDSPVVFAEVNCVSDRRLCSAHEVWDYPSVELFLAGSTQRIHFDGDRTMVGFADFVEMHTTLKANRKIVFDSTLRPLSPLTFPELSAAHRCVLAFFFVPDCVHSRRLVPVLENMSKIFEPDPDVAIGAVNCNEFREFCDQHNVTFFPTLRVGRADYSGDQSTQSVLRFVNDNCATERSLNGMLDDAAGTNTEADALVAEFFAADDKTVVINKVRAIQGCEFYVKLMERVATKGADVLEQDAKSMAIILTEKRGSGPALDGMKRRYNVITRFIAAAPKPTPREEI
jgi:protein disulfide-isomerase A6